MKNFKKAGVLILTSFALIAVITVLTATTDISRPREFSPIIRYEFKDLKTISDGTVSGSQENEPSFNIEPVLISSSDSINQIESFFEESENRSFEVLYPILIENEYCYKITVTGKTEEYIYPINVFAVNLKDKKKYFLNDSDIYERFYCVPKFACKTSPDGSLRIESTGMYMDGPSGLHQLKETRIIDITDGSTLFSTSSSLSDNFLWSPDSRFISVENSGRTWTMTEIIDTADMSRTTLPDPDYILNSYPETAKPSDNNSLLCFQALNWVSNSIININFKWQTENDTTVFGAYYYNLLDKTVEIKMIEEKNQG